MYKDFICHNCGKKTQKDSGSYYKQCKNLGYPLCKECGIKHGITNSVNTKHGDHPRNYDYISCKCRICNNIRQIKLVSAKRADVCPKCARKINAIKLQSNTNYRQKISKSISAMWASDRDKLLKQFNTPAYKEKCSLNAKTLWQNEEYRHKVINSFTDDVRTKLSKSSLKLWQDNDYRSKMEVIHNSDDFKALMSKNSKLAWQLHKDKILTILKSPEVLKRLRAACGTESFKQMVSLNSKKNWQNPEYRSKMQKIYGDPNFIDKMKNIQAHQAKTSTQQKILYNILKYLNIKYYTDDDAECRFHKYTFDCLIPVQDGLTIEKPLLIEVQGDYWHNLPKAIARDKSKSTYIKNYHNHDLKYLWEHEFNNKNKIIDKLKYWLKIDTINNVNFEINNIIEKQIDPSDAELFISTYHYASRIKSGVSIGYYLDNTLIAAITYQRPTHLKASVKQNLLYKNILELTNLAIHPQYQKESLTNFIITKSIGFIANNYHDIKRLIVLTDTMQNPYKNWTLSDEIPPDYWYKDQDGYICRSKTLQSHATSLCMTESEYSNKYNYVKVNGCNKYLYTYNY